MVVVVVACLVCACVVMCGVSLVAVPPPPPQTTTPPPPPPTTPSTITTTTAPAYVIAPYVSISSRSAVDLISKADAVCVGFVTGYSPYGVITWHASYRPSPLTVRNAIAKTGGGIVSFGGPDASRRQRERFGELAGQYKDSASLAQAYIDVASSLGCSGIDFWLEDDALADTPTIRRRHAALVEVRRKRKTLKLVMTVPANASNTDIDDVAKRMLRDAVSQGVALDCVNVVVTANSSDAVVKLANNVQSFVQTTVGANVGIVIGNIGSNGFSLADAERLRPKVPAFVKIVSYWSLNEDVSKYQGRLLKKLS